MIEIQEDREHRVNNFKIGAPQINKIQLQRLTFALHTILYVYNIHYTDIQTYLYVGR